MNWTAFLSVAIPSLIAVGGVIFSAIYIRNSQKEANKNAADANDTNSFTAVTDKLFRLIEEQGAQIKNLDGEVKALKEDLKAKDATIEGQRADMRQLARYIKRLLANWPANTGTPPSPEPPFDWAKHL